MCDDAPGVEGEAGADSMADRRQRSVDAWLVAARDARMIYARERILALGRSWSPAPAEAALIVAWTRYRHALAAFLIGATDMAPTSPEPIPDEITQAGRAEEKALRERLASRRQPESERGRQPPSGPWTTPHPKDP